MLTLFATKTEEPEGTVHIDDDVGIVDTRIGKVTELAKLVYPPSNENNLLAIPRDKNNLFFNCAPPHSHTDKEGPVPATSGIHAPHRKPAVTKRQYGDPYLIEGVERPSAAPDIDPSLKKLADDGWLRVGFVSVLLQWDNDQLSKNPVKLTPRMDLDKKIRYTCSWKSKLNLNGGS